MQDATLPKACPDCGGELDALDVRQHQTEILRQFNVHIAQCRCCKRRVQGRIPRRFGNKSQSNYGFRDEDFFNLKIFALFQTEYALLG